MSNQMKFEFPKPFALPTNNIHLVIAGAGGNGAHFMHQAMRVVGAHMADKKRDYKVTVFDGDIVEQKNLLRQNFYPSDLGKNKAQVTARRYSKAFGVEIGVFPEFVETKEDLEELMFQYEGYMPLLVTCFDNHKSRLMVQALFEEKPAEFMWLDLGNDEFVGQVVLGFNADPMTGANDIKQGVFKLPSIVEFYPEIRNSNDQFKSEVSCAEHAVANIQNIGANVMCSTLAFLMFNQLMTGSITHYAVRFDAKSGMTEVFSNTYTNLERYNA